MNALRIVLVAAMTLSATVLRAQSCFNIGFEDSSFVGWEGFTGLYPDSFQNLTAGIVPGQHTIMSGNALDSLADTVVTKVAPGSKYSVRLGNSSVGARHERLRYTLTVDSQNLIFVYGAALVFQDPGHSVTSQPYFQVRLLDSVGNELDTVCGKIQYYASATIPGFVQAQGSWGAPLYRDWRFAGVDLSPYYGQDVTVEFTNKDCAAYGHYGYAYIDAGCYPKAIITQYCEGKTDTIRMTAPLGFEYEWSTGDTGRVLEREITIADSAYFVTCTSSLTGCSFVLSATTEPTYYYDFDILENSCGEADLKTTIKISRGDLANFYWDFGDTTTLADTSNEAFPTYTYPGPGQYIVRMEVNDGLGCSSDTLSDTVNIYFPPVADFTADPVCLGDTTLFVNASDTSYNVASFFVWDFGDGSPVDTTIDAYHIYGSDSLKTVKLLVWSDSMFCADSITKLVKVHDRPDANFYHLEPDSCIPHEVHFVNQSIAGVDGPITTYGWDFGDGSVDSVRTTVHVYDEPGIYTVKLWINDSNDCIDSAVLSNGIRVYPIPIADFEASPRAVHITSPTITFTNLSNNADGYVWTFGDERNSGVGSSTEFEPTWDFKSAGYHVINLLAYSEFGCFDTAQLGIDVIEDRLKLTNVITPNADGLNDVFQFVVEASSISEFSCSIYNRWGQRIYTSENPGFSWDGTVHGDPVPAGVYFYEIQYKGFQDEDFVYQGEIQLLR